MSALFILILAFYKAPSGNLGVFLNRIFSKNEIILEDFHIYFNKNIRIRDFSKTLAWKVVLTIS